MIPIKDDNPSYAFPWVTLILIAINLTVFFVANVEGSRGLHQTAFKWGFVPVTLTGGEYIVEQPMSWITPFTSMFLHGGWVHIMFNMLFLWIFGDNVEDRLGKLRFLAFYVIAGMIALLGHVVFNASSQIPVVGASGAVAGVMGAYMALFPGARIRTLIIFFPFIRIVRVPAVIYLLIWVGLQILNQITTLGTGYGVAFGAHIAGFAAGLILLYALKVDDKIIGGQYGTRAPGHWGW